MLELGENSSQYHAELGKFIDSLEQIQSVYLIGDQIINTKNEIKNKDVRYFISKHMLLEELEKNCTPQDNVIFIKASRGMKLNTVFDELISIDVQTFLTGTDAELFEGFSNIAQMYHVNNSICELYFNKTEKR